MREGYRDIRYKAGKKASATEHDLQVACVGWFRAAYPKYAGLMFAIPNGGARSAVQGAKLKAEGVLRGVPDLMFAHSSRGAHGLFIEMKNGGSNGCTKEQKAVMGGLTDEGYECWVVRSFWDFKELIDGYIKG